MFSCIKSFYLYPKNTESWGRTVAGREILRVMGRKKKLTQKKIKITQDIKDNFVVKVPQSCFRRHHIQKARTRCYEKGAIRKYEFLNIRNIVENLKINRRISGL